MIVTERRDAIADFRYDPKTKRYRWREGAGKNQFAPKVAVLERTTAYLDSQSNELVNLADRLDKGEITLGQFQRDAAQALKQIHVSQAFLAADGYENLTDADWLSVGRTLKKHYYDGKEGDRRFGIKWLAQDIKDGKVSLAQLRNRLKQFAASGKETYWRISAEKSGKPYAVRLLGDAEHCEQCPKYASLPPQSIADVILPTQQCDCRMNCKCRLQFMTLQEAIDAGMKDPRNDASSFKFSGEDLLNLKEIIEETYTDGISAIISAGLDGDGAITGIFRDGRKRYQYSINPDEVIPQKQIFYRLLNPEVVKDDRTDDDCDRLDEWDLVTFVEPALRLDKKKKCSKGTSCGGSCINADKTCRAKEGLSWQSKTKAKKLKEKMSSGAAESSFVRARQAAKDVPKPVETKPSIPSGKKTEAAQQWEKAWDDAPDDLRQVLDVIDQPEVANNVRLEDSYTAHYNSSTESIFMRDYKPNGNGRDQAVWRHEYGHHLDNKIAQKLGSKKLDEAAQKLGYKDYDDMMNAPQEEFMDARRRLKKENNIPFDLFYKDELARYLGTGKIKKPAYYSSSDQMFNAMKEDESRLVALNNRTRQADLDFFSSRLGTYKERGNIPFYLRENPLSENTKRKASQDMRRMEFADMVKAEAERRTLEEFKGKKPKTGMKLNKYADRRYQLESEVSSQMVDEAISSLPQSSIARQLAERVKDSMPPSDLYGALKRDPESPVLIARLADKVYNSEGLAEDLIASITTNKVGTGHSDEYYARDNGHSRGTETFANLTAYHGISKNDPLVGEILNTLAPSTYQEYKKILKEIAR